MDRVATLIEVAITLAMIGGLVRRGFRARKPVWTPRSWRRFIALLITVVVVTAAGLGMAYGVDHGVYEGMGARASAVYLYALLAWGFLGPGMTAGLLIWFRTGRPERQL
jgi:hypothetical protein